MDATTAFETLTDLIDANKDKMPDYEYMKMMECMKTMFEKKDETPNIVEPVRDFHRETLLSVRNDRLTRRFYDIFTARSRCSNCGDTGHNTRTCVFNTELINFEATDDMNSFSLSVLIHKDWDFFNYNFKSKNIYDLISMTCIGIVCNIERDDIGENYIHSEIDGEFYYYNKQIIKDLLLTDSTTSNSMMEGIYNNSVDGKAKYFHK